MSRLTWGPRRFRHGSHSAWLQSQMACLLEVNRGLYLAHSDATMKNRHCLAETKDPLEIALVEAMKEKTFGVLRGAGHPPKEVIGFYRLQAAPWAIMHFMRRGVRFWRQLSVFVSIILGLASCVLL